MKLSKQDVSKLLRAASRKSRSKPTESWIVPYAELVVDAIDNNKDTIKIDDNLYLILHVQEGGKVRVAVRDKFAPFGVFEISNLREIANEPSVGPG